MVTALHDLGIYEVERPINLNTNTTQHKSRHLLKPSLINPLYALPTLLYFLQKSKPNTCRFPFIPNGGVIETCPYSLIVALQT